jgi:hypothetical protein
MKRSEEEKAPAGMSAGAFCLPKNAKEGFDGKEGCVRETQEGFPAPFESISFQSFFRRFENLFRLVKRIFIQPEGPGASRISRRRQIPHGFSGPFR